MRILVVGGAGYIGSHMVSHLLAANHQVVVFDNLSRGYRDAIVGGDFVQGDLANPQQIDALFRSSNIDLVMHFASYIEVAESVLHPSRYYQNNFINTKNLLDAMVEHGVLQFVFSSTAAVFGEPAYTPIDESHPRAPINPYGKSKLMVEQLLEDYDRAYGLKSVSLRYFNAAGADSDDRLGERHDPETHLIPLVLQAASGRRSSISLFGDDYDTPDGTCIRDYIHVKDLCAAHLSACDLLQNTQASHQFNLGNGMGYSVAEVIDCARRVTGRDIPVKKEQRRAGDPAVLVADSRLAAKILGWVPAHSSLEDIIESAWNWEQSFFNR